MPQVQTMMTTSTATSSFSPPGRRASAAAIGHLLAIQALIGISFALIVWIAAGSVAGYSALAGAAICVIPAAVFALRVVTGLLLSDAEPPAQMRSFYAGEAIKLIVTVTLFILAFKLIQPLAPVYLFTGFMITQASIMLALLKRN